MSDATAEDTAPPARKSGTSILIGLILAIVGGLGGYVLTSGLVDLGGGHHTGASDDTDFVPIEPMTVLLGHSGERRYLRFTAQLEIDPSHKDQVTKLLPRVVDVLNTYLRSLSMSDVEDPSSLLTLRSQMRRRIDLVVGGGAVRDLLVM
mgnify:CR=1 FL=1